MVEAQHGDPGENTLCVRTLEIDHNGDATARIRERENIMLAVESENALQKFVNGVVHTVQAVKFAIDWDILNTEQRATFTPEIFRQLNADYETFSAGEYKKRWAKYKLRHDKVIRARSDVRKLFLKVCHVHDRRSYLRLVSSMPQCSWTLVGRQCQLQAGEDRSEQDIFPDDGPFSEKVWRHGLECESRERECIHNLHENDSSRRFCSLPI